MTFALHTLGCKVNQCDGDALAAALQEAGYMRTAFNTKSAPADIYIINTCTVTHTVDKKAMQTIRRVRKMNAHAFIAVCGCMTRSRTEENNAQFDIADFTFDTRQPQDLLAELSLRNLSVRDSHGASTRKKHSPRGAQMEAVPSAATRSGRVPTHRTRAFLKVQDGCDRFCAYCIVPYVRGALTSLPAAQAVSQARELVRAGYKEIVLTGIQLAAYGKDKGGAPRSGLVGLIEQIAGISGLPRLRLSSLEPCAVDEEFLAALARLPAVCEHFHLSLQSGCDATLARMNRRYTTTEYARTVQALRAIFPRCAITTDIIAGFPGETDADHAQSIAFVREMGFSRVHVFPFSQREGTAAASFPMQVAADIKKNRAAQMLELAADLQREFLTAQAGMPHEVLFETPHFGHTRNYCPVRVSQAQEPNTIKNVHITGLQDEAMIGECI